MKRIITSTLAAVSLLAASLMGTAPAAQATADAGRNLQLPTPPAISAQDVVVKGDPHAANKAKAAKTGFGKSVPPQVPTPTSARRIGGPFFKYATGKQTLTTPSDGAVATYTISKPYINPTYDYHTLAELAVQSYDENNMVEVGWTRDQGTYGDNNVHLFVFAWKNGASLCYDGCGYVDYAANTTTYAGMSLESVLQTEKTFGIVRTTNEWWISFDGNYIGYFPDSVWTGAVPPVTNFKKAYLVQAFGEIAAGTDTASCADMGLGPGTVPNAGQPATTGSAGPPVVPATGAKIGSLTYQGRPTSEVNPNLGSSNTQWNVAVAYTQTGTAVRSWRYNGGGYC